ncbi:MAG: carbon-nitrogen hydrolase family protein [Terriglobales bacterium]
MIKIAAVQGAPKYLDLTGTLGKMRNILEEAADNGCKLIAFPEVYIPGYPYWVWLDRPCVGQRLFHALYRNSVQIPGPAITELSRMAQQFQMVMVVGVNEIEPNSSGTVYNTNLIFNANGELLGAHRKLVPTYAEKLVWGNGDGSGYAVHETTVGRVGALACGENTNTLARYALLAQGEQIHVANFPAFPFTNWYREANAIRIRCQAHAFEGKLFVLASTSLMDEDCISANCVTADDRAQIQSTDFALTGIFGPDGEAVGDLLLDDAGLVFGHIDLERQLTGKLMHDIVGHYNQPAILSLHLDARRQRPLHYSCDGPQERVETSDDQDRKHFAKQR